METVKFRPHHLLCLRFSKAEFSDRGDAFVQVEQKMKDIARKEGESFLEVAEGTDALCRVCPDYRAGRCESPRGNEEAVRKWDGIILKGLGASYGEVRTSKEWRTLIERKMPLDFCKTRCRSKNHCTILLLHIPQDT